MVDSKKNLRVALVGCGRIGTRTSDHLRKTTPAGWMPVSHAEAIKCNKNLELVALCDVDEEKLSWASTTYGIEKCYQDYKSLIVKTEPDILSIATRTAGRAEIIKFAAEHGVKGIHAEKPLSVNMADCKKALDAVVKNDVKLTYGTTRRFMDVYRKAKEIVMAGEIGELVEILVEHGKTTLMWNHPHSVDLLLFFSNCLEVVYCQATCIVNPSSVRGKRVDDDPIIENAFVKFGNGVNGIITAASGLNTRLSCTSGNITIAANGSWIEIRKGIGETSSYHLREEKLEIVPKMSGTQRAFCELNAAIRNNKKLSISPEEIAISQNLLFGFVCSSLQKGIRFSLPWLDDDFTVTGRFGSLYA